MTKTNTVHVKAREKTVIKNKWKAHSMIFLSDLSQVNMRSIYSKSIYWGSYSMSIIDDIYRILLLLIL